MCPIAAAGGDGGGGWNEGCGDEVDVGDDDPFSGVSEVSSGSGDAEEAAEVGKFPGF